MHTFVIVASRPGSALDPMVTDLLTSVAPACVGFAPQQHVHWAALDGSVHFGGWCAEELVPSTARTVDGRLVAIGGLPILTSPNEEASLLGADSAARDARALRGLTERLDGAYAIASLAPDGAGTVVNDPFGLHPLYLGGVGPVTAVSNDAALVATVLARRDRAPSGSRRGSGCVAALERSDVRRRDSVSRCVPAPVRKLCGPRGRNRKYPVLARTAVESGRHDAAVRTTARRGRGEDDPDDQGRSHSLTGRDVERADRRTGLADDVGPRVACRTRRPAAVLHLRPCLVARRQGRLRDRAGPWGSATRAPPGLRCGAVRRSTT